MSTGFGGPVIKDGKVHFLDRDDEVGDIMRCFNISNGKELWKYSYDAPGTVPFHGSRSIPTVDGNYIYSCGHNGDLYCIDINTHKPVWNKNVWTDYGGGKLPYWAISQCPLVYGDLLIVASQTSQAGVVAYDKLTGDFKWKTPSFGFPSYVSPAIVKVGREDHVVMITPSFNPFQEKKGEEHLGKIIGIEPLTGKVLWEYANWECHISVASALDAGEGWVLVVGGYELGTVMIKVEKKANGSYNITELLRHNNFGDHTKPPILHNGYFYAQFSTNSKRDGLVCMNMDGMIMWKTGRSPLFDKGSMILADGLILATDGRTTLYLIEPDPSGFKPLASAELLKEGGISNDDRMALGAGSTQNWGPLALADGRILLKDQSRLMCVKVAK